MNARRYYRQSHNVPQGIVFGDGPHVEDSGPPGRPCFRRGTMLDRPDIVCSYPFVDGSLSFWAVSDEDGGVVVGEDVDRIFNFDGDPANLCVYAGLRSTRESLYVHMDDLKYDWSDMHERRIYEPRVRCSRLAFVGGLGYEAGRITLPASEHPQTPDAPVPSAETFLGWYGYDTSHRWWPHIIDTDREEGWGRPAFSFTPLAAHDDQSWAYAPATPSRAYDVRPVQGTTTIPADSWKYESKPGHYRNENLPPDDEDVDNWWLLALLGGDPSHGSSGKVKKLYWNPEITRSLTYFGESGTPDLTDDLFRTILYRIYAAHCVTADIVPSFAGLPFPPGFLVDCRIIADTWECKCSPALLDEAGGWLPTILARNSDTVRVYLGTQFSVLYRCPFPVWRRAAS